jgi:type I restriction enzyme S subunit
MKLNQGNMNRIPFIMPPEPISRAFSETVAPLFGQLCANVDQSATIASLRDTLLPKLLSGALAVTDSQAIAEVSHELN